MEKISTHQLFCLILMGQIGSTNLWALGIEAKKDLWIAALFSMLVSFAFVWVFTELQKNYPNDNTAGLVTSILGKVIGWPLVLVYVLLYIYNATRNTSEFGDMINITFLQNTPRVFIIFIFLAAVIYILFLRIEALARLVELILPLVIILHIFMYIMIIASGQLDLRQLMPVFEDGIMPILNTAYPVGINFPFGLVFMFMQIWHYTEPKQAIRKTTFLAIGSSGLFLTTSLVIIVSTLGINVTSSSTIPLLEVIKLINIRGVITNMDAIGIVLIFIEGLCMTLLNFLSAAMILAALFKINDYRWCLIPQGVFILWYSNVYEPNYPYHVKFLVPQYWQQFAPLQNIIPVLLLVIFWLKSCIRKLENKP